MTIPIILLATALGGIFYALFLYWVYLASRDASFRRILRADGYSEWEIEQAVKRLRGN